MPLRDVEFSKEEAKSAGLCLVFRFPFPDLCRLGIDQVMYPFSSTREI
jgi:hypothetical protein